MSDPGLSEAKDIVQEGKTGPKTSTEVVESSVFKKDEQFSSGDFLPSKPETTTANINPETSIEPSTSTKHDEKNESFIIDKNADKIGLSEAYGRKADPGNIEVASKIGKIELEVSTFLKPKEEIQSLALGNDPDSQDEDIVLKWEDDDECMADLTNTDLSTTEGLMKTGEPEANVKAVDVINRSKNTQYNEISNEADRNNSSKDDVLSQIDLILEQDTDNMGSNYKSSTSKDDTDSMGTSEPCDENLTADFVLAATELVRAEETLIRAQSEVAEDNTETIASKLEDGGLDKISSEHQKPAIVDELRNDDVLILSRSDKVHITFRNDGEEKDPMDTDTLNKTYEEEAVKLSNMDVDAEEIAIKTDEVDSTAKIIDAAADVSNLDSVEAVANSTIIHNTKENNTEILDTSVIASDTLSSSASLDAIDHGLNQFNLMTKIPTQELINLSDNSFESSHDWNMSVDNTETQEEKTTELLRDKTEQDVGRASEVVEENVAEDLKKDSLALIEEHKDEQVVENNDKELVNSEHDSNKELVNLLKEVIKSAPDIEMSINSAEIQDEDDNKLKLLEESKQNMEEVNKSPDTNESHQSNEEKPAEIEIEKAQQSAENSEKEAKNSRQQMECDSGKEQLSEVVQNPETDLEKSKQKIEQVSFLTKAKEDIALKASNFLDTEKQEIQHDFNKIETQNSKIEKKIALIVVDSNDDHRSSNLPVKVCTDSNKKTDSEFDSENNSKPTVEPEIDIETFLKKTKPLEPQIDDVPNEVIDDLLFEADSSPDFNDDKDITMNTSVLENIIENLDSSLEENTDNIANTSETSKFHLKPIVEIAAVIKMDTSTEEAAETIKNSEKAVELNTEKLVSNISDTVDEGVDNETAMETVKPELGKEKELQINLATEHTTITTEVEESSTGECTSKEVSSVPEVPIDEEAQKGGPESFETRVESLQTSDAVEDVQPSTSRDTSSLLMEVVSSEDVAEVTDSLGLLAEFRAHDDQDSSGQDDSDGDGDADGDGSGDGDADVDYQDDESSNQMTIDQSEDSAQHSETDVPRPGETETEDTTGQANKDLESIDKEFNLSITNVVAGKEAVVYDEVEVEGETVLKVETSGEEVAPGSELIDQLDLEVVAAESTLGDVVEGPVILQLEQMGQLDLEVVAVSSLSDVVEGPVELPVKQIDQATGETKTQRLPTPVVAEDASTDLGVVDLGEISSEDDTKEEREAKEKEAAVGEPAILTKATETAASTPLQAGETAAKEATSPPTGVTEKGDQSKSEVEVLTLDSDEETVSASDGSFAGRSRCINSACRSGARAVLYRPDTLARAHYNATRSNKRICRPCLDAVLLRAQNLIADLKDFKPLLSLDMGSVGTDLVEISDSSSDSEGEDPEDDTKIGILGAKLLEKELAGLLNETWVKYRLDERMQEAQDDLNQQLKKIEEESAAVGDMLSQCQVATDALRVELYAAFDTSRRELPSLTIFDTPNNSFCSEAPPQTYENKRRLESAQESSAKRRAMEGEAATKEGGDIRDDDKEEVSVVQLSGELAPPWLPPAGDIVRPPLSVGMQVYAMRNAFGSWIKARVVDITPKPHGAQPNTFSNCKVKFENKTRTAYKTLSARCVAYNEPSAVRMTIGTRLIALFKDSNSKGQRVAYYSGVVAEVPNPVNKYRYLVFFDDGYAQYVQHSDTRLVCESSALVWEEVHPFSREFVKEYLLAYPERPMVRLHPGQNIKTEWNGKWWTCRVVSVDASLVQVYFSEDKRIEWIYRGSTRLAPLYLELQSGRRQAANVPRRVINKNNMPYVEYTRSEEAEPRPQPQLAARNEELRRQRAVAKKSTVGGVGGAGVGGVGGVPPPPRHPQPQPQSANLDAVTSRVVYYTPKNAVRPHTLTPHMCSPRCKRTDVLALKDLRTYNPLAKPLLSGWERQLARIKGHKEVVYRAPCGRRLRNMRELHRYLRVTSSDMAVDLFDFSPTTHCLAEFVLNKCIVGKKDLSHGKENVPVPCVNYYDNSLPEFCSYNTERTPTAGVPLNLDPDFLCGCDCTDDCEDKSKCACWQMTLEGARTIGLGADVGYVYKRLPEPLPSGIYECNSRCKCKQTCLNRVVQHPLQLKLQVFKTLNRGWGIRALNDVPKGSFLCIYAGNLLTDATANLDGLNEGDEYLAELDYIEVVEQMKEGYEEDVPENDKRLDEKDSESESESAESEEESRGRTDEDGDFQPAFNTPVAQFSKRLRKREKKKQKEKENEENKEKKEKEGNTEEDCITISDDEELREPARFAAQAGPGGEYVPKYRSVRTYFGKDEACYIMDAKVQGNIGRYLNHSCSPNVFVQNVFVDTHDPRFPWVAFFALTHVKAGTELTWNYNYDVGSVPGKALYCYCGSHNCRGRLL